MSKERQTSPTLDGIRDDHKARYQEAINFGLRHKINYVLDAACGVGYGSYMMGEHFKNIMAFDADKGAIAYAKEHYSRDNISHQVLRLEDCSPQFVFDLVTAFEIIEHTHNADKFLQTISKTARYFIGSVPNQETVPFNKSLHHFHVRHYTPSEIKEFLFKNGWRVLEMGGQPGKVGEKSKVQWGKPEGSRTIIFTAEAIS